MVIEGSVERVGTLKIVREQRSRKSLSGTRCKYEHKTYFAKVRLRRDDGVIVTLENLPLANFGGEIPSRLKVEVQESQ
jgi:hypothetical protein